jgi:hypothetical protein
MLHRLSFHITRLTDVCGVKDFVNLQPQATALCNRTAEWQTIFLWPRIRCHRRSAALRLIVQPCDKDD